MREVGHIDWLVYCSDIQSHALPGGPATHVYVLKGKAPSCKLIIESEYELPYRVGDEYFLDLSLMDGESTT